jgi:hypothetical protein
MYARTNHSDTAEASINERYNQCVVALKSLIVKLSSLHEWDGGEKAYLLALETHGRLRTWGEESHTVLPADSRNSLDSVLRNDKKYKEAISRTLTKIHRQVQSGMLPKTEVCGTHTNDLT